MQCKSIENAVGKREIARNEKFLIFPTVFSTRLANFLPFYQLKIVVCKIFQFEGSKICRLGKGFQDAEKKAFENNIEEGYDAGALVICLLQMLSIWTIYFIVVGRQPREREVVGSIPGRDSPVFKTGRSGFPPWCSGLWI